MPNFQQGKIYRIECLTTGKQYIGSTCEPTLARRLAGHVKSHKKLLAGKITKRVTSYEILTEGNYQITLIEAYPCETKDELTAREGYFIRTLDCVNKVIPGRTPKEYREDNKEQIAAREKTYHETNKEQITAREKTYRETNKEQIAAREKAYREATRVRQLERCRLYDLNVRPFMLAAKELRAIDI